MAIKYGFYNSIDGDRRYNAEDFGKIFEGIIRDGVFESVLEKFQITLSSGLSVFVGKGKAWFNHTWLENDASYQVSFTEAEVILNRIDAVVMEFDASDSVRANTIKVITGTPSSTPQPPVLTHTDEVNQYPLCYVTIPAQATSITLANINSRIGTTDCPYAVIESGEIPSLAEINKLINDVASLDTLINDTVNDLSFLTTSGDGTKVLADDGVYRSLTPVLVDTLTTSGTFNPANYDLSYLRFIFVMYGGGGGGGTSEHVAYSGDTWYDYHGVGGAGGAGGKTKTSPLLITEPIAYTIGAKGNGGTSSVPATDGGNTTLLTYTAGGGKKGTNGYIVLFGDGSISDEHYGTSGLGGSGNIINGQAGYAASYGARGGSSDIGTGGLPNEVGANVNATGYASGGASGKWMENPNFTKVTNNGGNGTPGVIFVYGVQFSLEPEV